MPDLYPIDDTEGRTYTVQVTNDLAGTRLDKFLDAELGQFSRSRIKALIEGGYCRLLGKSQSDAQVLTSPSAKVKAGWVINLHEPPPEDALPAPEDIALDIAYEDNDLLVVNKPAGMVVHPGAGNNSGTLVNALLHHCAGSLSGIGGVARPGIVHRIDKDTSGLLVVAKTDAAHRGLSELFAAHDIERRYLAIVKGRPNPPHGTITGNIARHPVNRKKMAVPADAEKTKGKHAVTHYRTLETYKFGEAIFASLVECRLETGRTHQARVHMTHIGHPLLGDPVYGRKTALPRSSDGRLGEFLNTFDRQALHAAELGFIHPVTGEKLHFSCPLPPDMAKLKKLLATS